MSSLCGIISFCREALPVDRLCAMGRSMILRGRDQHGMFLFGGLGLHHNRQLLEGDTPHRQPYTAVREGARYTVLFDGFLHNPTELETLFGGRAVPIPELLLDAYLAFGVSFVSELEGAFAIAILDERKKELFLARDCMGYKPLYYFSEGDLLVFSSEIGGLLRYFEHGITVDADAVRRLLSTSEEMPSACECYRDLCELPRGSFAVHSPLGLQVTSYRREGKHFRGDGEAIPLGVLEDGEERGLLYNLEEALLAFDFPCFEAGFPVLMRKLRGRGVGKRLSVSAPLCGEDLYRVAESSDRLGMRNGVLLQILPKAELERREEKEMRRLERQLGELLRECLSSADGRIAPLVSPRFPEEIRSLGTIEDRIRRLGVAIQCELWLRRYPIELSFAAK